MSKRNPSKICKKQNSIKPGISLESFKEKVDWVFVQSGRW